MNNVIKTVVIKPFFLLFLLFLFVQIGHVELFSQTGSNDTLWFSEAQKKITTSTSGTMNYTLNYVTSNLELHWNVNLVFAKDENNNIFFYVKQSEDSVISEYVYYKDTLLIFANYKGELYSSKKHTTEAFKGNIRRNFFYLLDEQDLTRFFAYDNVVFYDTVIPPNKNAVVCKASAIVNESNAKSHYNSLITVNKNNYDIISSYSRIVTYLDGDLFYEGYKEYLIDSIALFNDINKDICSYISQKYNLLDHKIISATSTEEVTENENKSADSSQTVPKYAYSWTLPQITGDSIRYTDIKSKLLVLDFYFTTCAPCILSLRDMVKLDSLYDDIDVSFVAVNALDKDKSKIEKFLHDRKITLTNVIEGAELSEKYGFSGFPQLLIIDTEKNEIIYHCQGYRSDGFEFYKSLLDEYLSKNQQ